jgi:hypothetical protein
MEIVATARERLVLARDHGPSGIRATARKGGLERIGRGTYLKTDDSWETWERARVINAARTIAALAEDETSRAGLTSAVVLWGLPLWQLPTTVDILVKRSDWRRPVCFPAVISTKKGMEQLRRRAFTLDENDHAVLYDAPTVGLHRLATDVALSWHPRDALVTVDGILARLAKPHRADRHGTEDRAAAIRKQLAERLGALSRRRGLLKARAVIEAASPWSESPGESVTRWAALALGLPEPICQYRFTRSNGRFYYLDLLWERYRAGAEFDGLVKYKGDQASEVVVAEKKRDDEIRRTGIQLLHLDTATANRPGLLGAALRGLVPRDQWVHMRTNPALWVPELGSWNSR